MKTYEDGLHEALAVCMQYAVTEYTHYSELTGGDCDIDWTEAKRAVEKLAATATEQYSAPHREPG